MHTIIKTSYSQNNLGVFELTTQNHSDYCIKHGYTYHPVDEPYNPYIDVDEILGYLTEYDLVVTMGVDVLIQHPETPIERFAHDGVTMCRELQSGTLNADLILYTRAAIPILNKVADIQNEMKDGQTALNHLSIRTKGIYEEPMLQIAAPVMNDRLDYKNVCIEDYFALHYHTVGKMPTVTAKADGLKKDLNK